MLSKSDIEQLLKKNEEEREYLDQQRIDLEAMLKELNIEEGISKSLSDEEKKKLLIFFKGIAKCKKWEYEICEDAPYSYVYITMSMASNVKEYLMKDSLFKDVLLELFSGKNGTDLNFSVARIYWEDTRNIPYPNRTMLKYLCDIVNNCDSWEDAHHENEECDCPDEYKNECTKTYCPGSDLPPYRKYECTCLQLDKTEEFVDDVLEQLQIKYRLAYSK